MRKVQGFSLIEMLMALAVLTPGLLAAGQLIYAAVSSGSLARSKTTAAIAARDTIEDLATLYSRDPSAGDVTTGEHGPRQVEIVNPLDAAALNRFNVWWNISRIPDPRPGKMLHSRRVRITLIPIDSDGSENRNVRLNKVLNVATIFGPETL